MRTDDEDLDKKTNTVKETYICTLSGGKDSTAMLDLLLRDKRQVDYILFHDTLCEFPQMYEYLDKLKAYLKSRYNREIIVTKPVHTFEELVFGRTTRGGRVGAIRGIVAPQTQGYCALRRDAKMRPFQNWIKENIKGDYKIYIGFTVDEERRTKRGGNELYPLIDDYHMSEADCVAHLRAREMENPLYRHFSRTGCKFCPAQSFRAWVEVYRHYPETWAYMVDVERRLTELEQQGNEVLNKSWFSGYLSCAEMEQRILAVPENMFVDDTPLKDCFCAV